MMGKIAGKYYTDLYNILPTYLDNSKVGLSDLRHWFKQLAIITSSKDRLDLLTKNQETGKTTADKTKIKAYLDSKELADKYQETLTELGLDLTKADWETDLTAKLNGAKISDIPADSDLSELITSATDLQTLQANYKILDDKLTQINDDLDILTSDDNLTNELEEDNTYEDLKTAKEGIDTIIEELGLDTKKDFLPDDWYTRLVDKDKLDNTQAELTRLNGEINKLETDLTGLIDTINNEKRVNAAKLVTLKGLNDGLGANPINNQYNSLLTALNYTPHADDINDPTNLWKHLKVALNGHDLPQLIQAWGNFEKEIRAAFLLQTTDPIPHNWHQTTATVLRYVINDLNLTDDTNLPAIPVGEDLNSLLARPTITQLNTANQTITQLNTDKTNLQTNNATLTNQRADEKARADTLQAWKDTHNCLDGHTCPQCQVAEHADYDTIKQERDQLKTHECNCDDKVKAKESEIITKIITDLQLATEKEQENVLDAIITEIKTKITPPDNGKDSKISELETEIANLKTRQVKPTTEQVKKVTEFVKKLDIPVNYQLTEKLTKVTSYEELFKVQQNSFEGKLTNEIKVKNDCKKLNYCLGALSIGSLLALVYLLIKRTSPNLPEKEKKD